MPEDKSQGQDEVPATDNSPLENSLDTEGVHNPAESEGLSARRISVEDVLIGVGILIIVLLIGAASYVLWISKNAQDSYEISLSELRQNASEAITPGLASRRIDTSTWSIYENNNYQFQLKYPPNLEVFEDLTPEELNGYQAEDAIVIKDTESTTYMTILINPAEDIEYYPNKFLEADYSDDSGVYITSDDLIEVPDEYVTPGKQSLVISDVSNFGDTKLAIVYVYNEDNQELEPLFGDILHTFRSTEPDVKDGYIEHKNEIVGVAFWYAPQINVVDGGDYVLLYETDGDVSPGANIYDGVNIRFVRKDLTKDSLRDVVVDAIGDKDSGAGFAVQPEPITVGNLSGYFYEESGDIRKRHIFLEASDNQYILIIDSTGDYSKSGYRELADELLDTLRLIPVNDEIEEFTVDADAIEENNSNVAGTEEIREEIILELEE